MADPKIRLKRSSVEAKIPTADQLPLGEVALNTYDGKLYASKNVGIGTTVFAVNPWSVGVGTNSYNTYFTSGNVGIGSTNPSSKLDVDGIITATTFSGSASNMTGLTGASAATYGSSTLSPVITVNSDGKITGISNATISGGGGGLSNVVEDTAPQLGGDLDGNSKSIYGVGIITATTFSGALTGTATTATNLADGANITTGTINVARLGSGASGTKFLRGDNTWQTVSGGGISDVVDDTSPQLGGNLDLNSKYITGTGGINVTGVITATTFYGDGSNLTNAGASAAKSAAIASFLGR